MGQHMHHKSPRKRRKKATKRLFKEIMAENFLELGKQTDIQIQEAHKTSNKMNLSRECMFLGSLSRHNKDLE